MFQKPDFNDRHGKFPFSDSEMDKILFEAATQSGPSSLEEQISAAEKFLVSRVAKVASLDPTSHEYIAATFELKGFADQIEEMKALAA